MRSADGRYWMVYNGEIYNYIELGQELREQGVVLRTTCDSEVLLETYARVGKDVVHRLRGMYAFAIWDTWTRELFCARDPFGIKPFYYCIEGGPDSEWSGSGGGGRHAAPAMPDGQISPPGAQDWAVQPTRRPGRHAAGPPNAGHADAASAVPADAPAGHAGRGWQH